MRKTHRSIDFIIFEAFLQKKTTTTKKTTTKKDMFITYNRAEKRLKF